MDTDILKFDMMHNYSIGTNKWHMSVKAHRGPEASETNVLERSQTEQQMLQ